MNRTEGADLSQQRGFSFDELEKKDQVSADELKQFLREYAEGGWAINARGVKSLIDRVTLTQEDLMEMTEIANRGIEVQERKQLEKEKGEYQQVINYIESKR
jgi:hypothetical protein